MKGRPAKLSQLPRELREKIHDRLRKPGFRGYERLAQFIRWHGYEIPISSLRRARPRLLRDPRLARSAGAPPSAVPEVLPSSTGVTLEALMQLAQEKLCSALAEIDQLKQGDMSRLAHAVAHLTQAAVSLQRWNDEVNRRSNQREKRQEKSKVRGGLSAETSQALRNALLGLAPFKPDAIEPPQAAAGQSEIRATAAIPAAGEFQDIQQPDANDPAPGNRDGGSDDEDGK